MRGQANALCSNRERRRETEIHIPDRPLRQGWRQQPAVQTGLDALGERSRPSIRLTHVSRFSVRFATREGHAPSLRLVTDRVRAVRSRVGGPLLCRVARRSCRRRSTGDHRQARIVQSRRDRGDHPARDRRPYGGSVPWHRWRDSKPAVERVLDRVPTVRQPGRRGKHDVIVTVDAHPFRRTGLGRGAIDGLHKTIHRSRSYRAVATTVPAAAVAVASQRPPAAPVPAAHGY